MAPLSTIRRRRANGPCRYRLKAPCQHLGDANSRMPKLGSQGSSGDKALSRLGCAASKGKAPTVNRSFRGIGDLRTGLEAEVWDRAPMRRRKRGLRGGTAGLNLQSVGRVAPSHGRARRPSVPVPVASQTKGHMRQHAGPTGSLREICQANRGRAFAEKIGGVQFLACHN